MDKYCLFSHEDDIIRNNIEGHPRWSAQLSNGLTIYQDDFRQYNQFNDERSYSTWVRLRDYCYNENVNIVKLSVQFRTNKHVLPENADGYYFCKSILGGFGMESNLHFFITGFVSNNIIKVWKWQVPEMILIEEQEREIKKDDLCLILKGQ